MLVRAALGIAVILAAGAGLAAERQRPQPNLCAGFGPGFQALPGTTTCVRMSGHVRGEADVASRRSGSLGSSLNAEARATMDARTGAGDWPLRGVVQTRGRRGAHASP
jgi:Porin subfamily